MTNPSTLKFQSRLRPSFITIVVALRNLINKSSRLQLLRNHSNTHVARYVR